MKRIKQTAKKIEENADLYEIRLSKAQARRLGERLLEAAKNTGDVHIDFKAKK